jgi:NosR/NirI family transcriptional regulator, nitrous oxide reductase regulator
VKRTLFNIVSAVFAVAVIADAQGSDARVEPLLKRLFPNSTRISAKEGAPPHFSVFGTRAGAEALIGFGFWTTELEPLERGYDGPIKILVGMDTRGILAGVVVVDHHEPYGYFSVEPPAFAAQFVGKSVRDPFKVGDDIDAVSRASITMLSATRAIRNSARRMATQFLTP